MALLFLPPATKLGQGNIFRSVCQEFCSRRGGGHVWWGCVHGRGACVVGVCVVGGMHGGDMCVCGGGACMVGGHVWRGACMAGGGMHGRGMCVAGVCMGGHAWQGVCMAGGCVWQGVCMAGGVCGRYYEIQSMSGQWHPPGMHFCLVSIFL